MSKPHQIIETEYSWEEFVGMVFDSDLVGILWGNFELPSIKLKDDRLEFWNGGNIFSTLYKENNEIIKYGFGVFYLTVKSFEQIEVGEDDEGYPIYEDGENFMFIEHEVKLFKLRQFLSFGAVF